MVNTQCLTKCLRRAEGNDSLIFSAGLVVFLSTVRHWNILYFFHWFFGGELIKSEYRLSAHFKRVLTNICVSKSIF